MYGIEKIYFSVWFRALIGIRECQTSDLRVVLEISSGFLKLFVVCCWFLWGFLIVCFCWVFSSGY